MYNDSDIYILNWINNKKFYNFSSKKYPKKFKNVYGIDFDKSVERLIELDILCNNNDIITLTELGKSILKEKSYIIWIEEHTNYGINKEDFINNPKLNIVSNNDIAWGIFQNRYLKILMEISQGIFQWEDLYKNYYRMSELLCEENRNRECIENFIFGSYIQFSGLKNDNKFVILPHVSKKYNIYSENGDNLIYMQCNIHSIRNAISKLNIGKQEFINEIISEITNYTFFSEIIPFHYFNTIGFAKFLAYHIYDSKDKFVVIYDIKDCTNLNMPTIEFLKNRKF